MIYWQVIDLETGGLDPVNDEIAEIAVITCKNADIIGVFHQFYEISKITEAAAAKNNLTISQLQGWKKFHTQENYNTLKKLIRWPVFAHNSPFDIGFLIKKGILPESYRHINTVELCRKSGKGLSNNKLQTWLAHYGLQNGTAHTALDDAFNLARLIMLMGWQIHARIN
ncbi:MAG: exonuclease domain-containing protein [Candidatus Thorarchaeota archaeon]